MTLFPGERALRDERREFLATMESLPAGELESGTTLCAEWSPRDVLAHVIGIDDAPAAYLRNGLRIGVTNARLVSRWRERPVEELLERARRWAVAPALTTRFGAYGLLGDLAVHHQDVLRGTGRRRSVPEASARAILREGVMLGGRALFSHRVVPDDVGRAIGRGREVRGTAEALGLWLCGRRGIEPEIRFAPA